MTVQLNVSNEEFIAEKQRLPDNVLSFVPKTGTTHFDKHQMFEIVIPRTNHIINLRKACFIVEMKLRIRRTGDVAAFSNWFVGMNNAACIFDQVQIKNNGRTIWSNTMSQVSSRTWQMSKGEEYLDSMNACFLNYNDINRNIGHTYIQCSTLSTDAVTASTTDVTFRMRIPLAAVFEGFDNCDNFYTTALNDDVVLSLELSEPYKYLTLVNAEAATADGRRRVVRVEPFTSSEQRILTTATRHPNEKESQSIGANDRYLVLNTDSEGYYINQFKLLAPCHYPTPDEKEAFTQLISGGSVSYPFKSFEVDQFDVDLGAKTVAGGTAIANQTIVANFASNAPNIYGLMVMFAPDDNRVVFDKPYISNIECNLNEIIKLANNRVHTLKTYEGDNDMYRDFVNNFGGDYFKHISRFDKAITFDYFKKTLTDTNLLGSYIQWYQIAAGNQLGFSGDYFANLINYKCRNEYISKAATPHNHNSTHILCCALTQRMLIFKDGGLAIVTPFSEEVNMRNVMNSEADGTSSHGLPALIPALAQPIKNAAGGLINLIKNKIDERRGNKNTTYAYEKLGKDGYMENQYIIEKNQAWRPRKFRAFIDRLAATQKQIAEHGMFIRSHGLGTNGYEGGLNAPISTATGIPKAKDVVAESSANANIDNEKALTLDDLNLPDAFTHTHQYELYLKEYKNTIPLDYKIGLNREKIKLTSYGNEMSMELIKNGSAHGLRERLRRGWERFKGWFKRNGERVKENVKEMLPNLKEIARSYANDILTGRLKIGQVDPKYKDEVLKLLSGATKDTDFAKIGNDVMDYYQRFKAGKLRLADMPREIAEKIREMSLTMNNSSSKHGLLPRHGFLAPVHIHPSVPRKVMKARIAMMLEKPPELLKQKDLRKLYMFKYSKLHKDDMHGISREVWRKLKYGNHRIPDVIKPYRGLTTKHPAMADLIIDKPSNEAFKEKYKSLKKKIKNGSISVADAEEPQKLQKQPWFKRQQPEFRKYMKKMGVTKETEMNHGMKEVLKNGYAQHLKKKEKKRRQKATTGFKN